MRELRLQIDESKLGPDSPLRDILKRELRAPARDLEHREQARLYAWAAEHVHEYPELEWMFAVPNWFGVRTAKQGARAKAEGRKAGVPDNWLPIPRSGYLGCVIEMKSPGRYASPEQKRWLARMVECGWLAVVCYSFESARDTLIAYLTESA